MPAAVAEEVVQFQAQPGPQAAFLKSPADIVVYGGSAYGGKTFGLLMEGTRHKDNPDFTFTIFRQSMPQIKAQGALWDESFEIYPHLGAAPLVATTSWRWPSGCEFRFTHLEDEKTLMGYKGAQICLLGFDQLEEFTERQFFYMLSRNRSGCGVRPYCRATCNPPRVRKGEARHWLRSLLDWWIKGEDYPKEEQGFPIPERSGVIRHFTRRSDKIEWVEAEWRDPEDGSTPKSLTFIPARYSDNRIGLKRDPGYLTNLNLQGWADRRTMKEGNWDVSEDAGLIDPAWFKIEERPPKGLRLARYWDRAATEPTPKNPDPDFTAGALGGLDDHDELWILDMQHFQKSPAGNEEEIARTAEVDGQAVPIVIEEEGGASGKDSVDHYQSKVLKKFTVHGDRPDKNKILRSQVWRAKAERGKVHLVRGTWNHPFLAECATFPHGKKDQVDAVSGLHKFFTEPRQFRYGALAKR